MSALAVPASRRPDNAQGGARLPNAAIGMALLVTAEVMFFAGLVSAYMVARAHATDGWPPPSQPRLPVLATAFNTLILLASLWTMRRVGTAGPATADVLLRRRRDLWLTVSLGALFLILQGREWIALVGYGLTTHSSVFGAFFYTIIGAHAVHVAAGLVALCVLGRRLATHRPAAALLTGSRIYWGFVVLLWPVLYVLVYLL